jgi:hypothetical protein
MRPCHCNRCNLITAPYTPDQCRLCWLYHHDRAYRALWDSTARAVAPCRHRGEAIDLVECPTCQGRIRLKVFACDVYGRCTVDPFVPGTACCSGCLDYESA